MRLKTSMAAVPSSRKRSSGVDDLRKTIHHRRKLRLRIPMTRNPPANTAIVQQLAEGDMQARIKAFLSGQDILQGLAHDSTFSGDSIVRELVKSCNPQRWGVDGGTTRERAVALEKTLTAVQPKLNSIRNDPMKTCLHYCVRWIPRFPFL